VAEPSFRSPGRLRGWRAVGPGTVALELEDATAELLLARDGTLRLRAAAGDALPPDPGPALERARFERAPIEPLVRADGAPILEWDGPDGAFRVQIDALPFAVRLLDAQGRTLAALADLAFAAGGAARLSLAAAPDERFFGFGEKSGGLDKRGARLAMRNRDANLRLDADPLYASIPFFLVLARDGAGARATGFLLDVFAPSSFDVARADPRRVELRSAAGGIDLAVFPGPAPRDVLRRMSARVGRTPRPPRWALGHHQSRWSYASAREVRAVARELRARGIPTDAIHLDIDHMDGYRVFTFQPRRFRDPKRLFADLAQDGFRAVAIVDPGVKVDPRYGTYRRGLDDRCFCERDDGSLYTLRVWPGEAALPDFNRPEVRAWWGEEHRPLIDAGVAGIWNDMNEPAGWERDVRVGRVILPWRGQDTSRMRQADPADPARSVPHEAVRNLYGQQQSRATRAFLEAAQPERRAFVLSRSGFAGIQRYAALWTGDNHSTWASLRLSLPMLLNLSLSGVPFCGADIGGFAFPCTPELYARWIQIGALYPFARTHSMWGKPRQEAWRFGPRVEAIARAALELRMRLLPYLYGLFCEAEESGAPVWRPLFYEFPDDPEAAGVEDQVMLGPALLAAPVLRRGARARDVYLPAGTWFAWDDDARVVGPRRVRVAAPLERLPLFVRAGTPLATQSPIQHTTESPAEPLVIELFPGADGEANVVEDDGESTAYRRGAEARRHLSVIARGAGRLRLQLGSRVGDFDPGPRALRVCVRACPQPARVVLDAAALAAGDGAPGFRHAAGRLDVRFADDGRAHVLEVDPAP
jgi:alpha-glucosidase